MERGGFRWMAFTSMLISLRSKMKLPSRILLIEFYDVFNFCRWCFLCPDFKPDKWKWFQDEKPNSPEVHIPVETNAIYFASERLSRYKVGPICVHGIHSEFLKTHASNIVVLVHTVADVLMNEIYGKCSLFWHLLIRFCFARVHLNDGKDAKGIFHRIKSNIFH